MQARPAPGIGRPSVPLAWACVAFIVYGSLFPFDFSATPLPASDLLADWNPFHDRSDAVDNILLFIPLGLALQVATARSRWRLPLALLAWAMLGVGLQVVQLWLPSRVASLSDAVNNAIGLAIGMGAAGRLGAWLASRRFSGRPTDRFALLLVAAWYAYESFPFVPTLDVGLLAAHVKPLLKPPGFETLRLFRHALAASLGTLALLAARPVASRRLALGVAGAVVLLSEVTVAYGDLRIETLLGIVLGMAAGAACDRLPGERPRQATFALAAIALLMTVTTAFRGPSTASGFTLTPFSSLLWQGTMEGIPTVAFEALAIGAALGSAVALAPAAWGAGRWALTTLAVLAALEALRHATHSGPGDSGNFVVAAVLLPFALAWRPGATPPVVAHEDERPAPPRHRVPPAAVPPSAAARAEARRRRLGVSGLALGLVVALTVALWFTLQLPSLPYNVREMFDPRTLPRLALFSVALLWLGAGPGWVVRCVTRGRMNPLWLPLLVVAAGLASLLLLRLSVTQESLDDITGSTDMYRRIVTEDAWGADWRHRIAALPSALVGAIERGVRYTALYALLLVPLAAVALCGRRSASPLRRMAGVALLLACGWLARLIVVDAAVTDNLVELIARGGQPFLAALLLLLALNVALAAGRGGPARLVALAMVTAAALPGGWWLLKQGLEPTLIKYGQVSSALQFLLGRDRATLLTEGQLFTRWGMLYAATLVVLSIGMALMRRWDAPGHRSSKRSKSRHRHGAVPMHGDRSPA